MSDLTLVIVPVLSFAAIAAMVFVVGHYLTSQVRMQQRLPAQSLATRASGGFEGGALESLVARHFDGKRFGLDSGRREKLRAELIRAGYFGTFCVQYYILARVVCAVAIPLSSYVLELFFSPEVPVLMRVFLIVVAVAVGVTAPDAFVSRRQRLLAKRYRQVFPDSLDLLAVCVDAGMTAEIAFGRVQSEIAKRCSQLGKNIEITGAEMRAGRSTVDALESLAQRLNIDEASSLVTMLRQSIELGSDTADALRIFSEEMRGKRLLRAEETANKLSVKMVIPLGIFIFPVILLVILLPVIIKLMSVLR